MRQMEFTSLLFVDVEERAAAEAGCPLPGKPAYYGRPWTQLRDEMVVSGAKSVAELSASRIAVFYHSTKVARGGLLLRMRGRLLGPQLDR
jgi:hypothetical protein